jgi:hypothetical protein
MWLGVQRKRDRPTVVVIKVLDVGLRVVTDVMDDAVPMIRRGKERIELQRNTAGIDDVAVYSTRRNSSFLTAKPSMF